MVYLDKVNRERKFGMDWEELSCEIDKLIILNLKEFDYRLADNEHDVAAMAEETIPDKVGGKLRQRRLITADEFDDLYQELSQRVIDLYDPDEHWPYPGKRYSYPLDRWIASDLTDAEAADDSELIKLANSEFNEGFISVSNYADPRAYDALIILAKRCVRKRKNLMFRVAVGKVKGNLRKNPLADAAVHKILDKH